MANRILAIMIGAAVIVLWLAVGAVGLVIINVVLILANMAHAIAASIADTADTVRIAIKPFFTKEGNHRSRWWDS